MLAAAGRQREARYRREPRFTVVVLLLTLERQRGCVMLARNFCLVFLFGVMVTKRELRASGVLNVSRLAAPPAHYLIASMVHYIDPFACLLSHTIGAGRGHSLPSAEHTQRMKPKRKLTRERYLRWNMNRGV